MTKFCLAAYPYTVVESRLFVFVDNAKREVIYPSLLNISVLIDLLGSDICYVDVSTYYDLIIRVSTPDRSLNGTEKIPAIIQKLETFFANDDNKVNT